MAHSPKQRLFRHRDSGHDHSPVTMIELFFDLVFVFAVTQLSHRLLSHLTLVGAVETLILFLAIWWVWIYTSWSTNWLDPDHASVRLMLLTLMLTGLALSSAVPDAFGATGLVFAGAYCAMQIGRTGYMVWASMGVNEGRKRNFLRIEFYFLLTLPLWLVGATMPPHARMGWWAAALAIEYAGPFLWFRTPFLGHSIGTDWDISGTHMAERCALFIIIALGEAVLVTGSTFSTLSHDGPTITAFIASFLGSAVMWWIYFDIGAKRGSDLMSVSENAGQMARNAYTYLHMPIVAGVIVTAVADEQMLMHPHGPAGLLDAAVVLLGPLLFLLGNQLFKWITSDLRFPPLSHFIGMLLLLLLGLWAHYVPFTILQMGIWTTGILTLTTTWEWFSLHGGWRRWLLGQKPEAG